MGAHEPQDALPTTTARPLLELNNVEVIYDDVILVLKGLSLQVREGQIVALLGSNGAGKSTTLKAISGLLVPEDGEVTDGSIQYDGMAIHNRDPALIVRRGIFQVMEGRRIFEHLNVEENLRAGRLYPRAGQRNQCEARSSLPLLPSPRRAQAAGGRLSFRWRAADAGDRPRFDARAAPDAVG